MQVPIDIALAFRLESTEEQAVNVEDALTVNTLLGGKFRIDNRSSVDIQVAVDEVVNYGLSSNTLTTGTFTTNKVTVTLPAGGVLWHDPDAPYLKRSQPNSYPQLTHVVRLSTQFPSSLAIAGILIMGTAEETTLQAPFPPTVVS